MNPDKSDSNKLLKQCFEDYRIKLFKYCLARLDGAREDADDCVQDAFLVLQKKLSEGETVENPRAFLYRTADNFVKRRREEKAKSAKRSVPLEFAENTATVEYDYLRAVDETDYDLLAEKLINTLTPNEKQLYDLRYRQKNEVNQIAGSLGISPAAVSMRLMRLRDKVKQIVYEKGG
ncbi:MAG: sigma-70 family RNA polymerase sigma factor [Clostridia bacterium]|nr:sigma-70 family RNA polymerase sigma factor [Clostridia bacterium]